jgi:pectate lyase
MVKTFSAIVASCIPVSAALLVAGCGAAATTPDDQTTGGTTGTGGVSAGGATGSGGATGGSVGTGGAVGTGGSTASCTSSQKICSGQCVNANTDLNNCGSCGNACPAGQTCSAGVCGCAGGQLCGTTCTDTGGDANNCGSCGNVCPSGQLCDGGTCSAVANCPDSSAAIGWASQNGGTTGGGSAATTTVTSLSSLNSAASGTTARVIVVSGTISGDVTVGSNKTIRGACGGTATIQGHIQLDASSNVILRNLNVVGYNCTDASTCDTGADAVTIQDGSHNILVDHCDISDGSDGNLDITHGSDYVTVSWTKFHYSSANRSGGHEFSNLIGGSATNGAQDSGHLRTTFHHVWWADNVDQRQPRVRFGQVHIFNSLYTATGNTYCVGVGADANILVENTVFIGVRNPFDSGNVDPTAASVLEENGNIFTNTSGSRSEIGGGNAFTPPYTYTLDTATTVQARVQAGAGPL